MTPKLPSTCCHRSIRLPRMVSRWKKNGWKTADKKPVKNADLWLQLDEAQKRHKIDWRWVKGHSGHEFNERADELANRGVEIVLVG